MSTDTQKEIDTPAETGLADKLERLLESERLNLIDVQLAKSLCARFPQNSTWVGVSIALASHSISLGHTCAELSRSPTPATEDAWPSIDEWERIFKTSTLVGKIGPGSATPRNQPAIVIRQSAASLKLYLRRYWNYENDLAQLLEDRLNTDGFASTPDPKWVREQLDRLFGAENSREIDWQRWAAMTAMLNELVVISGGPGTGKTTTVVKLLALLCASATKKGEPAPKILLLAPTGKAAARLSESVNAQRERVEQLGFGLSAVPDASSTIHRALSGVAHRQSLDADIVLVDEASMIDVALMRRLLVRIPRSCKLILLGDQDQLASVEAGAVLADICGPARSPTYPRSTQLTEYGRIACPSSNKTAVDSRPEPRKSESAKSLNPLSDTIVELQKSYRFGTDTGIGALAHAIRTGNDDEALRVLFDEQMPEVALVRPKRSLRTTIESFVREGYAKYLTTQDEHERIRAFDRFRILAAVRKGPNGVEQLNTLSEACLEKAGLIKRFGLGDDGYYLGRPIMIRSNDYDTGLFNGDIGLITHGSKSGQPAALLDSCAPAQPTPSDAAHNVNDLVRVASFPTGGAELRHLPIARIPQSETVYAMSIHKSQGSEFEHAFVVLPESPIPLLTRELLYTAVTRARERVTIVAEESVLRHTIRTRINRHSGLNHRLWNT